MDLVQDKMHFEFSGEVLGVNIKLKYSLVMIGEIKHFFLIYIFLNAHHLVSA